MPLGHRSVSYGPASTVSDDTDGSPGTGRSAAAHRLDETAAQSDAGGQVDAAGQADAAHQSDTSRRRHCWVRPAGDEGESLPGLVIDWRRGPGASWWGFTQYVVDGPDSTRAILEWVPADRLRPR